jgi:hypothetical protein
MSHLNRNARLLTTAALTAAVWSLPAPHAHAAPFVTFSLVGRLYGSSDAFSSVVRSASSGAIEYQVIADMAPTGTVNIHGTTTRTITSLTVGTDGLGTIKIDIFESAVQALQLSFNSPVTFNPDPSPVDDDSWAGFGSRPGIPTARPGQPGQNDLINIFSTHQPGVRTAIDPEIMMTGVCQIDSSNGSSGLIQMRFSNTDPSGVMKINGSPSGVFISGSTESTADPLTAYNPMSVVVAPEPTSLWQYQRLGIAPMRPRRNRQHHPILTHRSAARLRRKPPIRRRIAFTNPLLPEDMHARLRFALPARNASGTNPSDSQK